MSERAMQSIQPAPRPAGAPPTRLKIWLQAIRIFSFTASVIPILVASAMALVNRAFDPVLFVVMVLASVACHAGANLANDYFDHVKGIDTEESLGPSKVIQQHLLTPAEVKRGMILAFGIATVLGLLIVAQSGWPILVLALLSLAAAFFYTGGPKPLGYIALGELTVFVFMGLVMIGGAYYVYAGRVTWQVVVAAIAVAAIVAEILHANNMRDIELDRRAGKVTLATLLGRRHSAHEYLFLVALAYLAVVVLVIGDPSLWPALLVIASLPSAIALVRIAYRATEPAALNRLLRRTAGLHLRFGALLTGGLVVRAIIDRIS
jgi:1,4-dihydroxy-2-naphthoate octaprenyltransferase